MNVVLMVLITSVSSTQPSSFSTQEFKTFSACEAAKVWIDTSWKSKTNINSYPFLTLDAKCVPIS